MRTVNTSLTTLCVILALLLFGGSTIYYFILVLFVGLAGGHLQLHVHRGPAAGDLGEARVGTASAPNPCSAVRRASASTDRRRGASRPSAVGSLGFVLAHTGGLTGTALATQSVGQPRASAICTCRCLPATGTHPQRERMAIRLIRSKGCD